MRQNEDNSETMGFDELPLESQLELMAVQRRLEAQKPGDTKRFLDRSFHRLDVLWVLRVISDRENIMRLLVTGAEDAERFDREQHDVLYEEWAHEFDLLRHLYVTKGERCMKACAKAITAVIECEYDKALRIARITQVGEENILPIVEFYKRNVSTPKKLRKSVW